ncbi:MAG: hypothetical protein KDK10_14695 [Maritimibacter sp.]|nr:hypothetical protein [Maritimibacter sp.]
MFRTTKLAVLATVAFAFAAPAKADIVDCTWDYWGGGTRKVAVSWLGTKARLDTTRKIIGLGYDDGWAKPRAIEQISNAGAFTAYIYNIVEKDVANNTYKVRMSMRIYPDGRGELIQTQDGYVPMSARGTCVTTR